MFTTTNHQQVGVTAPLAATGRKYGPDADTSPTGDDALANNAPCNAMLVGSRFKDIRTLNNDLEALYDMRADTEELDNLAIKPERRARLAQMRELSIAELREDDTASWTACQRCEKPGRTL